MTRVRSTFSAKHGKPGRRLPAEGSRLRSVYDTLHAGRGKLVHLDLTAKQKHSILPKLRDFYGCDIEYDKSKGKFRLTGEWDGPTYQTYGGHDGESD